MNRFQIALVLLSSSSISFAQEQLPQSGWEEPNRAQEKLAESHSVENGVRFLKNVARQWGEERRCVTCHTNGYAMVALRQTRPESHALTEMRTFAGSYLRDQIRLSEDKPGRERVEGIVATTAMLIIGSVGSEQAEHPAIRQGLDYAWSRLSDEGMWQDWLQCNWPPFESDACFGSALMLVALGKADAADKRGQNENSQLLMDSDRRGVIRLIAGLKKQNPLGLHDKGMRLWAGRYWPGLVSETDKTEWLNQIREKQNEDGGWSINSLSAESWKHDSGQPLPKTSDAYPTAFITYVLREVDGEASAQAVERGKGWLASRQRESGRWFSRSPRRNNHHFITHAATAFAVMCLEVRE